MDWYQRHADAVAQEDSLGFRTFSHTQAWQLGSSMVATASASEWPVTIAITFGEQRVFHAALLGSSASNDDWLAKKFRTVAKHNCSSWALACLYRAREADFFAEGGYSKSDLALAGGAVPLRVQGLLIGAVGVSGLDEHEDHQFVVDALRAFIKMRSSVQ